MPDLQLVLSDPKTRRSAKVEVKDPKSQFFIGLKIGDTVDASSAGIPVKLKVTGGSDRSGTPMRSDIIGTGKKKVLLSDGPGLRLGRQGFRKRKLVRGNTISPEIYQINAVLTEGELPKVSAEETTKGDEGRPQRRK
jgi:small subunit ribosomal protein S6e